jgi:hypothetical protein
MAIGDKISWDALRRIGAINPVIKWGVIIIVAAWGVELLAERALVLYKNMATVQGEVAGVNSKNCGLAGCGGDPIEKAIKPDVERSKTCPPGQKWVLGGCHEVISDAQLAAETRERELQEQRVKADRETRQRELESEVRRVDAERGR